MKKLLWAVLAALSLSAAPPDPIAWKFQDAPGKPVKAGTRFEVKLVASIQDGWHLYSMKPMADGPIPTRIWVAEGQPVQLAAAIKAAAPQTIQDPSFNMEVELYEGAAEFTLPLKIAATAAVGTQTVMVNASYQTCNNRICLPPKTVKLEFPVTIK